MSIVAAIRSMMDKGFTVEQALLAAEAFEEAQQQAVRSAGAERQQRYRDRLKASRVTDSDACDVTVTPSAPSSPEKRDPTPQETLTPPSPPPSPPLRGAHGSSPSLALLPEVADPIEQAVDAYNTAAQAVGWSVVQRINPHRRSALKARLKDCGGIEGWRAAMAKAVDSPFLTGDNDRGWKADFDFFIQSKSFTKLMEGGYDRRASSRAGSASVRHGSSIGESVVTGFAEALAERSDSEFGRSARVHGFAGTDDG